MGDTPSKYVPETRDWERKSWLYGRYWGQMQSTREMAEDVDVNHRTVGAKMDELGIPRRPSSFESDNSVSPFTGFYSGDEATTDTNPSNGYDPDFEPEQPSVESKPPKDVIWELRYA